MPWKSKKFIVVEKIFLLLNKFNRNDDNDEIIHHLVAVVKTSYFLSFSLIYTTTVFLIRIFFNDLSQIFIRTHTHTLQMSYVINYFSSFHFMDTYIIVFFWFCCFFLFPMTHLRKNDNKHSWNAYEILVNFCFSFFSIYSFIHLFCFVLIRNFNCMTNYHEFPLSGNWWWILNRCYRHVSAVVAVVVVDLIWSLRSDNKMFFSLL